MSYGRHIDLNFIQSIAVNQSRNPLTSIEIIMKIALIFPGQGSQYTGMGKSLFDAFPEAAVIFRTADKCLGFSVSDLCFYGTEAELADTLNAQLCVFVTSMAALNVLNCSFEGKIRPVAVAGHSLGEYSALVAAGVLDFADALRLIKARGKAMREAGLRNPGGMLAVLCIETREVIRICDQLKKATGGIIEIANDNCFGQIVVAGSITVLDAFIDVCQQKNYTPPKLLKLSVAPHTSLMKEALPMFLSALHETHLKDPLIPIIGNVSATWLRSESEVREELKKQLVSTVKWRESMIRLINEEVNCMIEVGPQKVLTGLMKIIDRKVKRFNFGNDETELEKLKTFIK